MILVGLFKWWYSVGWLGFGKNILAKLRDLADFFSFGLILKTFFAPFRQISAGSVDGSIDARLSAFFDRLFSRFIGAIVRLGILIFGLIALVFESVAGLVLFLLWPVLPVAPVFCLILTITGVSL